MRIIFSISLIAAFGVFCGSAMAAPGDLLFKITAPAPEAGARFGTVVAAVDGDIVVGEPARLHPTIDAPGRAYLFDGKTGGLKWTFNNPEITNQDLFGLALTGGDGRVFISTSGVQDRVYAFSTKTGQLLHTIYEPGRPGGSSFGDGLTYGSGSVMVSNPSYSLPFQSVGRAYVFDAAMGHLQLTLPNPEPKAGDDFGSGSSGASSLAVFGNKAVVGALSDDLPDDARPDGDNPGRVWVFDRLTGQTIFTLENPQPGKLPPQFLSDFFGLTVAANEHAIVVVAMFDDPGGVVNAGSVYLFDSTTGALRHTLYNPQVESGGNFGHSIAVTRDGNVLVGAWATSVDENEDAGHVYLFDGQTGSLLLDIPNPEPAPFTAFGWSVAALDDRIIVGARSADLGALRSTGSVYVFEGIPEPSSLALGVAVIATLLSIQSLRRLRRKEVRSEEHSL